MPESQFLLKTAPPRLTRAVPARARLERRWTEVRDRTAVVVVAPQGFGKTTLLAQWRRNWLEQGAYVAWASLDARDDRSRFVDLLLFVLRTATGRDAFGTVATRSRLDLNRELDTLTTLLAEVASLAKPTVVVLDDAHRMPQEGLQELMSYLLNNAPPNLQVVIGSRRPLELQLTDLIASGRAATVDANDLRLTLDESLALLKARFGTRIDLDDAVRVHDVAEGWPLGLQLAASTIERAPDLHGAIAQLSARRGDLQRYFFESLLAQLPATDSAFLTRIAILEVLDSRICAAITGHGDAGEVLARIANHSPVLTEAEDRDWMRMHALARDFLLGQFDKLPAAERRDCHRRAATWYVEHEQPQDAARHALAAGDEVLAVTYASRCLRDIAREGRLGEAREWARRLPSSAMSLDVHLQLAVAWITALGDDAATAPALLEQAARHPDFDEFCRFEAALIAAAAAIFSDRPGPLADALQGWERPPAQATPLHVVALANSQAILALVEGSTEKVRQPPADPMFAAWSREPGMRLVCGYSDLVVGSSWLLEGRPAKAQSFLQPRLELAERETGRRSPVAAMLAGALAAALLLQDQPEPALALLADRLDVIERVGWPESVIFAYQTLAEAAVRAADESRALDVLVALHDYAARRKLPRVTVASLAEQARLHALAQRAETAADLLSQIAALRTVFERPEYRLFAGYAGRAEAFAGAYVHLARGDLERAEADLERAVAAPANVRQSPQTLRARALRALVAHLRDQPDARAMLAEVLSLAELSGMRRYVVDAHPQLSTVLASAASGAPAKPEVPIRTAPPAEHPAAVHAGGLLTPKEARILALLAMGKANKEIARAMDIGEQTVKWHLKNVFFKLNAGSRKHVVDRARLLGLLPS
jgi:LuxR family maltose regulon positive regulatory protein